MTSSVIPRMRRALELRSERAACKSSSIAPPRAVSLESPKSAETTVTGESLGRSILGNTAADNTGRNAATHTGRNASATNLLLRIVHLVDRHLACVGIHITHACRAFHADGNRAAIRARMRQHHGTAVLFHLDGGRGCFQHHIVLRNSGMSASLPGENILQRRSQICV